MKPIIAPSILAADFARLDQEIQAVKTADWLHLDVMDGQFVPNITIGVPVVESLRKATDLFLDLHLMIVEPQRFVRQFVEAGADLLTFHVESDRPEHIRSALDAAAALGVKVALALRPGTPAQVLTPYLKDLDMVLIMTVEPGFAGQKFMADQMDTVRAVRQYIDEVNPVCRLEVDGGIDSSTIGQAFAAGADVFVAGSSVFSKPDRAAAIEELRRACHG